MFDDDLGGCQAELDFKFESGEPFEEATVPAGHHPKAFVDDIFGLEKASRLDCTASCEARNVRWTLHSDDPVTEMNPLRCIKNAVTRSMWRADEPLAPEECVSVESALRAMTLDAAWQCHSDHEVGSLEVGKFADFVVLEEDPREVETSELGKIKIQETWVHGKCVYASEAEDRDSD